MIKVVFLIGKGKEMLDFWEEKKIPKKKRIIFEEKGMCGFKAIKAAVFDKNNTEKKYCFHFFLIPEKRIKSVLKIMEKMNAKPGETILVTLAAFPELMNGESKKRYGLNLDYGWVVYFKEKIKLRDVNEFAAVFFREGIHEKLRVVVKEKGKDLLKKSNGLQFFIDEEKSGTLL